MYTYVVATGDNTTTMSLTTIGFVTLLIQVGLPILVGLVTKWSTKSWVKSVLLILLTVVNTYIGLLLGDHSIGWRAFVVDVIVGFIISVGSYYGLLKHTPIIDAAQNTLVKDEQPPR